MLDGFGVGAKFECEFGVPNGASVAKAYASG
jgi:hypothetical protein